MIDLNKLDLLLKLFLTVGSQIPTSFGTLKCHPDYDNKYCLYNRKTMSAVHSIRYQVSAGNPTLDEIWIGLDSSKPSTKLFNKPEKILNDHCNSYAPSAGYEWQVFDEEYGFDEDDWQSEMTGRFVPREKWFCEPYFRPLTKSLDDFLEIRVQEKYGWVISEGCAGSTECPAAESSGDPSYDLIPFLNDEKSLCAYHTFKKCIQIWIPTESPTNAPTIAPSDPTNSPTVSPSMTPTAAPSDPTNSPTNAPSDPTNSPTLAPSDPTNSPTTAPTDPTNSPTAAPSDPTSSPTSAPFDPTNSPTTAPSDPTNSPTTAPSDPTNSPTAAPSDPTNSPTSAPSDPTNSPTNAPSDPTNSPTNAPSTSNPTNSPTNLPTSAPTDRVAELTIPIGANFESTISLTSGVFEYVSGSQPIVWNNQQIYKLFLPSDCAGGSLIVSNCQEAIIQKHSTAFYLYDNSPNNFRVDDCFTGSGVGNCGGPPCPAPYQMQVQMKYDLPALLSGPSLTYYLNAYQTSSVSGTLDYNFDLGCAPPFPASLSSVTLESQIIYPNAQFQTISGSGAQALVFDGGYNTVGYTDTNSAIYMMWVPEYCSTQGGLRLNACASSGATVLNIYQSDGLAQYFCDDGCAVGGLPISGDYCGVGVTNGQTLFEIDLVPGIYYLQVTHGETTGPAANVDYDITYQCL